MKAYTDISQSQTLAKILNVVIMDYEKIKSKILKVQELMSEIPQDCKGNSVEARCNRRKFIKIKSMVSDLIESL